jgi:hypothetical protein
MSFESDLVAALGAVAGGRVYPQVAPEEEPYPLVNYRIVGAEPIATIDGALHATKYQVVFECWAKNFQGALDTADAVRTAIQASSLMFYHVDAPGEEYDLPADSYMKPVYFGFLHQ